MELRSVTRAADRLGLTQSAVSHALRRLRVALGDPLFVRGPEGLNPTERAEDMAPGVHEALNTLRGARAQPVFDPSSARRRFTIAAASYFCALLVPALTARIRHEAPGVALHVVPVHEALVRSLDRGSVDLALGAAVDAAARFVQERLYGEEMVWVAAGDNPIAAQPFDAARVASLPRVMISVTRPFEALEPAPGDVLQILPSRHIEAETPPSPDGIITVYDSQTAVAVAARTDHVALVAKRIAIRGKGRENIAILGPAPASSFEMTMLWHSKHRGDAGHAWLRNEIRHAADQ
jgi:DNA-binding transcriptional LysR family regulator